MIIPFASVEDSRQIEHLTDAIPPLDIGGAVVRL